MQASEMKRLEKYLQTKFNSDLISLRPGTAKGSVELYAGKEFMGTVYKDTEDGEVSYDIHLSVLEMDIGCTGC